MEDAIKKWVLIALIFSAAFFIAGVFVGAHWG
jgi:hypothetical protein